jgi:WD domain, G-beta repeat/Domain of unknown function (DUF4034)
MGLSASLETVKTDVSSACLIFFLFLLEAAMPFRVHVQPVRWRNFRWLLYVALLLSPAQVSRADDPTPATEQTRSTDGKPAPVPLKESVPRRKNSARLQPGTITPQQPSTTRAVKVATVKNEVLNQIDTTRDIVYATPINPVPESEQYQFIGQVLRTPGAGDARLCLPVEVPKYYQLSLFFQRKPTEEGDSRLAICLPLGGRQFFIESGRRALAFGNFFDQRIAGSFPAIIPPASQPVRSNPPGVVPRVTESFDIFVGERGFLVKSGLKHIEWVGPSQELSLGSEWSVPAADKIYLSFPDGQFEISQLRFIPLSREEWLSSVIKLRPNGRVAWYERESKEPLVSATIESLPAPAVLEATIVRLAREANFDELERWAARLRKEELSFGQMFAAEQFYRWLSASYLPLLGPYETGVLDSYWQQQLAFCRAWLEHSPDSVAARVVAAKTYVSYAWEARGSGLAGSVTEEGWKLFHERIAKAEEILQEAVRKPVGDSCVFAELLLIGRAAEWDRKKMDRTLERGVLVSKKNFLLFDNMATYLLPRWFGQPGDVAKFAEHMLARVKGDDGLEIYGRLAHMMRMYGEKIDDFSPDNIRAAVPVLLERFPKDAGMRNFACWLCCQCDDRETAKIIFASLGPRPDFSIWGSRKKFDDYYHWADPSFPEPSTFMAVDGEEALNLQAYSADGVQMAFLADNRTLVTGSPQNNSYLKVWDLKRQKVIKEFGVEKWDMKVLKLRALPEDTLYAQLIDSQELVYSLTPKGPDYDTSNVWQSEFGQYLYLISDDLNTEVIIGPGHLLIYQVRQKKQTTIPSKDVALLRLSPDGKHLITRDEKIHVWDTNSGQEVASVDAKPKEFVEFTEDNSGFIYATETQLAVWDIAGQRERLSIPIAQPNAIVVANSTRDGRYLAAGELRFESAGVEHLVVLRDLNTGHPVHTFRGHKQPVVGMAFSDDGQWLASSSSDGVVKVWDVAKVLSTIDLKPDDAPQVADSPN